MGRAWLANSVYDIPWLCLRKQLFDSSVLSYLDLCLYLPRVKALYPVFTCHLKPCILFKLGWLPMREQRDCWHLLKANHEAFHNTLTINSSQETYDYLLETVSHFRSPCFRETVKNCNIAGIKYFQDCASKLFNLLPPPGKPCTNFPPFHHFERGRRISFFIFLV